MGRKTEDLFCILGLSSSAGELTHKHTNFRLSVKPLSGVVASTMQRVLDVVKFYSTIVRIEVIITPGEGPVESSARNLMGLHPLPCFLSLCSVVLLYSSLKMSKPTLQKHSPFLDTPFTTTTYGKAPCNNDSSFFFFFWDHSWTLEDSRQWNTRMHLDSLDFVPMANGDGFSYRLEIPLFCF